MTNRAQSRSFIDDTRAARARAIFTGGCAVEAREPGGVRGLALGSSSCEAARSRPERAMSAADARGTVAQGRRRRPLGGGGALFDEDVATAKKYRTGAPPRLAHAAAEVGQVLIGIHDVSLRRLSRHMIVSTVVQGDPEPPEPLGAGDLWPPQGGISRHQARSTSAFANSSSHPTRWHAPCRWPPGRFNEPV